MKIVSIKNIEDFREIREPLACTIGNFDGFHLGHQKLMESLMNSQLSKMVISFENLPKYHTYFMSMEDKIKVLEPYGIDYLIFLSFPLIQMMFPNEFMTILAKMGIKEVYCGRDFRFGYQREGDLIDLKRKFSVIVVEDVYLDSEKVSTSKIRNDLNEGLVEEATKQLGRFYSIQGIVCHGNKIGRTLGFPTANLEVHQYYMPKHGIYVCLVSFQGRKYLGMLNIGNNPTLNKQENLRFEVHIFNFTKEIYGEKLSVELVSFLREEEKFDSKEALILQMADDYQRCLMYQHLLLSDFII